MIYILRLYHLSNGHTNECCVHIYIANLLKDTQKNVINFTRTPAVMCFYDYYYYYCFLCINMRGGGVDIVMMMTLLLYNNNNNTSLCLITVPAENRINCLFFLLFIYDVSHKVHKKGAHIFTDPPIWPDIVFN